MDTVADFARGDGQISQSQTGRRGNISAADRRRRQIGPPKQNAAGKKGFVCTRHFVDTLPCRVVTGQQIESNPIQSGSNEPNQACKIILNQIQISSIQSNQNKPIETESNHAFKNDTK